MRELTTHDLPWVGPTALGRQALGCSSEQRVRKLSCWRVLLHGYAQHSTSCSFMKDFESTKGPLSNTASLYVRVKAAGMPA